ncbi:unnamed protein product [Darwinula stevensoni]|uniref:Glycylpeptide N-tetradecanoyltransferase n=1 Tax=Darwinula stevensoni TaxID=69355 RepID=A0A7R8XFL0_9CRUS|nr:unnamed protein product [Darwinula stevensoni]CAG0890664.1 unnamed protein product [Darwinula stevensoni]
MADPVATMNGQEGDEEVSLPLQDGTGDESGDQDKLDMETKDDMQRAMEMIGMHQGPAKSLEEAGKKHYQFWETQPVPQFSEKAPDIDNGPIVKERPAKHELRQEPYSLPQGFQWDTLDINSPDIALRKYSLAPVITKEDCEHWFLPRQDIVNSYVVETQGKITDFASFYTLPSTVMHHPTHKQLKAAYSFYNASTKTPWVDLIQDALITAKNLSYDVFNALDLMENTQFLEELKFGVGDGNLHYYLYNWRCQPMTAEQVPLQIYQI